MKIYDQCCGPYIAGKAEAPTAEALMRARYSGYATGNIDFVERTHAAESRADFDRKAAEKWSRESKWLGLKILATKNGGKDDDAGVVNFVARFEADGQTREHHEIASFRKDGGQWHFVDGQSPKPETFVKSGSEQGRNDPCACGSGKKFKKCHGR